MVFVELLGLPDGRSDGVIGFVTGKRISRVLSCTVIYLGQTSRFTSSSLPKDNNEAGRFSPPI